MKPREEEETQQDIAQQNPNANPEGEREKRNAQPQPEPEAPEPERLKKEQAEQLLNLLEQKEREARQNYLNSKQQQQTGVENDW